MNVKISLNWRYSPITFLMSFPSMFNKTIRWNIFGKLYNALLCFRMIIEDNSLKLVSQYWWSMHVLAILMISLGTSHLCTALRCFYKIQSGLGVNKLLHLLIVFLNPSLEKDSQVEVCFDRISSKTLGFICWSWAKLNIW